MIDAGRWSKSEAVQGLATMYSALVKAHACAPILYVYTNYPSEAIPNRTLFGTGVRIVVREPIPVDNVYSRAALRGANIISPGDLRWIALSRSKLDVVER